MSVFKWIISKFKPADADAPMQSSATSVDEQPHEAIVIPRSEHGLSRAQLSQNALKVLYRLKNSGYQAYLVGGGVRDSLLGHEPKDFDVGTDAHPEDVRQVFRNCRLVGRRFRLAHVHFGREIIEVATFRALSGGEADDRKLENGRIVRDNVYGSLEDDAFRRDFTVNALYYNIADFSVVDYTGGMQDLKDGILRLIGDPERRYREDPVRMLRAVRFTAKLGFRMAPETEKPIAELAGLLEEIPPARLFDEVLKLFLSGYAVHVFEGLRHYDLFAQLFPLTDDCLAHEEEGFPIVFVARALENTDRRIGEGRSVTPAFLFAVLLWEPVRLQANEEMQADGELSNVQALHIAADRVLAEQAKRVSIPKRFSQPMREIWTAQLRFFHRNGKRPQRFLEHPRFRAAWDFFALRAASGEVEQEVADWWEAFQVAEVEQRSEMTRGESRGKQNNGRRRRRRRSRKPRSESAGSSPAQD